MPIAPIESVQLTDWQNFHATVHRQGNTQLRPKRGPHHTMADYGAALRAIVASAFADDVPLRPVGALWSLSNVVDPGAGRILETSDLNQVNFIGVESTRGTYRAHVEAGKGKPVLVDGGTHIRALNDALGAAGLALRTSGAADGHRIAGLLATGTHGSSPKVGCLHDTVKAIHLMIAPDRAVLLMPEHHGAGAQPDAPFAAGLADELGTRIGIPTTARASDAELACALVSLGSCGVVLSVIVDAAPLYVLQGRIDAFTLDDVRVQHAIEALDPTKLGFAASPYHFAMVCAAYAPQGEPGFYVTVLHERPAGATPYTPAPTAASLVPSDCSECLAALAQIAQVAGLGAIVLPAVVNGQTAKAYGPRSIDSLFPGHVFGPTRLPPGHGKSTELCFDQKDAWRALEVIRERLGRDATFGQLLLGSMGIRFVPATRATLGMSIRPMNCFIELPSIAASFTAPLFERVWSDLDEAGIPYAFHWGQEHRITPAHAEKWYGARLGQWRAARESLLPDAKARRVFGSPILKDAGLG